MAGRRRPYAARLRLAMQLTPTVAILSRCSEVPRRKDDIDVLSELGADGWELVSVTPSNVAYLKRPLAGTARPHPSEGMPPDLRTRQANNGARPNATSHPVRFREPAICVRARLRPLEKVPNFCTRPRASRRDLLFDASSRRATPRVRILARRETYSRHRFVDAGER